ncbi:MAG: LysR family transcriptional regulator [Pelosinus sp.]|nr:LysR family transcriptional regulator [Pelosinus sp.]
MDIKQLRYFQAIAEEGHITGAAKRLFITQPSLSQQLKLLENELGITLVERGNRGIRLTEAGQLLKERAGQILELLHTTATELKELHEGYKGTLAIGAIASAGVTMLPGLVRDFHAHYPQVKFQLWEGDTYRILDLLNNGIIEVGIARSVFNLADYNWVDLPDEPMIAAITAETCSKDNLQSIAINELEGRPLLIHRSNVAMITECCQNFGFEPDIFCTGDDVRSLLVWANEGMGLAIVPKSALGLVPGHKLRYIEISDAPLKIKKSVIWLRARCLSAPARHFIQAMFPIN